MRPFQPSTSSIVRYIALVVSISQEYPGDHAQQHSTHRINNVVVMNAMAEVMSLNFLVNGPRNA